jgi:hypothetical protein
LVIPAYCFVQVNETLALVPDPLSASVVAPSALP